MFFNQFARNIVEKKFVLKVVKIGICINKKLSNCLALKKNIFLMIIRNLKAFSQIIIN